MRSLRGRPALAAAALACALAPAAARAQSLTVTLAPSAVNFTLATGAATNAGNAPIAVTTAWTLQPAGRTISVYGYFTSAGAALAHSSPANTFDIPSSRVEVSINGGAHVPFDQTVVFGAAGAGRLIASQVTTLGTATSVRTDTLQLNINLSGYPLPADTFTGTLRLRAQASP